MFREIRRKNKEIREEVWAPYAKSAVVFGKCRIIEDRKETLIPVPQKGTGKIFGEGGESYIFSKAMKFQYLQGLIQNFIPSAIPSAVSKSITYHALNVSVFCF